MHKTQAIIQVTFFTNMDTATFNNISLKPEYILGLLLFVFLAYGSSMLLLPTHWSGAGSAGYNHGYLVLASSIYLLYLRRKELAALKPSPNLWALLPLLAISLIWFLASSIDIQTIQFFVLPFLLICMVYVIFGVKILKISFIPIIIILFALPIWQPALPILQDITTFVTHQNLKLAGRPVFVEGNFIHVSGGDFFIDVSCSGLRFLLVSTILSLMNSNLNNHTFKQTIYLLSIATALSFLANWIRVFIIIMIGDFTKMEHSLVHDHLNFGWVVYGFATLIPYFIIARRFKPNFEKSEALSTASFPLTKNYLIAIVLTTLVTLSGPSLLALYKLDATNNNNLNGNTIEFNSNSSDLTSEWQQLSSPNSFNQSWQPDYQGSYLLQHTSYQNSANEILDLHIIHYPSQKQDSELINVINSLSDDSTWEAKYDSEIVLSIPSSQGSYSVRQIEISPGSGQLRLMWYWYDIGGQWTTNNFIAKLLQVRSLFSTRNDASLLAASIPCNRSCDAESEILESFVIAMEGNYYKLN